MLALNSAVSNYWCFNMSKVYIISWEYLREELCENSVVFVQVYFVEEVSNGVEALEISLLNC